MKLFRRETAYEKEIVKNVSEFGCHITVVFDPDGHDPGFAYSTGFNETVHQSEVIVFGLRSDLMQFVINETLRQCRAGLTLEDWRVVEGLLDNHRCIARAVSPECLVPDYFNSAMWFHRRQTGKELTGAFQIVWPGAVDGLFPWEAGCDEQVRALQPELYTVSLNS